MASTLRRPNGGGRDPERLPPFVRPAADFVARIRATVHTKLLAGFLVIAVLLVAMGITSILVIREMNQEAHQLISLQEQTDIARQAIYAVTSQSHFRAMALITQGRLVQREDRGGEAVLPRRPRRPGRDGRAGRGPDDRRDASDRRALRRRGRRGAGAVRRRRFRRRARPPHLRRARDLPRARGRAEPADRLHRGSDRRGLGRARLAAPLPADRRRDLLGREPADRAGSGRGAVLVGDPPGAQDGPRAGTDRRRRLRADRSTSRTATSSAG